MFTDTLGDVNGVARFITGIAALAHHKHQHNINELPLRVFTSTRKPVKEISTITCFKPRLAIKMPMYPLLDVVVPPAREMLRAAETYSPDVVHVSTPGSVGLLGRWFAVSRGLPLVGVYHTDFVEYTARFTRDETLTNAAEEYMRWFYKPFNYIVLRSAEAARPPRSTDSLIPPPTIRTLQPGVDTTVFSPAKRTMGPPGTRALYVGRLSVEKNVDTLIRIWKHLEADVPGAELTIVGDGPARQSLTAAAAGCNITFTGFMHGEELARAYADADIFVFPSNTETLGQTVLEACASGVVPIITNRGGPSTIITHDVSGCSLPLQTLKDELRWAKVITQLFRNPSKRAAMAQQALETAKALEFSNSYDDFIGHHLAAVQQPPADHCTKKRSTSAPSTPPS